VLPGGVAPPLFAAVVRTAFGKRRKTLRNSLKYLPYGEALLRDLEKATPIALDRRAEELTLDEFITLTKDIERLTA
jgi:16S rRNA (adenine1518-N6/adenine1519-N6)-dimethyltransferase